MTTQDDIDLSNSISSFTISIHNRDYSAWSFHNECTNVVVDDPLLTNINPLNAKLFNGDIITIQQDTIIHKTSPYTNNQNIPGVLLLEGNKTFGRTPNKKRLYYKCIPFDNGLPAFLIPYNAPIGFSKVQTNHYVTFHIDNWTGKHPYGILTETIGSVDDLNAFYEYQLYCNNLNTSISQFTKTTNALFKQHSVEHYIRQIATNSNFQIEDRQSEYIFSIDPNGSLDFDDAFSIQPLLLQQYRVSIYIANVYVWLETLNLWNEMTIRPSTIYLPDRKRTMLPPCLSDDLCSLQENQPRFALAMDIIVDRDGRVDTEIPPRYTNVLICVKKNFVYEEPKLLKNSHYKTMFELSKLMDPTIIDSHDVVAHFMVLMNAKIGEYMKTQSVGIFRSATYINQNENNDAIHNLNGETGRLIRTWNNTHTQYTGYSPDTNLKHDIMGIDAYVHITSPIRRIVDLINQMILLKTNGIVQTFSPDASAFVANWLDKIDYINSTMKSIRKVQTDCELLTLCVSSPEIMENIHTGILFDKNKKTDTLFTYMVYMEDIKMLTRITSDIDCALYTKVNCKLYLFQDEDKVRNKIRTVLL